MTNLTFDRRTFICSALAAGMVIPVASLSGCGTTMNNSTSGNDDTTSEETITETDLLPLGSIVSIRSYANPDMALYMIVDRFAQVSTIVSEDPNDEDEVVEIKDNTTISVYAGIRWPFGLMSFDISEKPDKYAYILFGEEGIEEVKFIGYQDDNELLAASLLDSVEEDVTSQETLLDLREDIINNREKADD